MSAAIIDPMRNRRWEQKLATDAHRPGHAGLHRELEHGEWQSALPHPYLVN